MTTVTATQPDALATLCSNLIEARYERDAADEDIATYSGELIRVFGWPRLDNKLLDLLYECFPQPKQLLDTWLARCCGINPQAVAALFPIGCCAFYAADGHAVAVVGTALDHGTFLLYPSSLEQVPTVEELKFLANTRIQLKVAEESSLFYDVMLIFGIATVTKTVVERFHGPYGTVDWIYGSILAIILGLIASRLWTMLYAGMRKATLFRKCIRKFPNVFSFLAQISP